MSYVLAFDLGASSGRAMLGHFNNGRIELEEIHRFANDPVTINGRLYWDILRLFYELKQSLLKIKQLNIKLDSIAIDSWAVDFGLLDEHGQLLANPFHYRDEINNKAFAKHIDAIGANLLYEKTGIQLLSFNTLFQLIALKDQQYSALKQAKHFLMIPSLLRYFLTGKLANEFTNATTTQLLNANTRDWDDSLIALTGLQKDIFVEAVEPGTVVGQLHDELCRELGIEPVNVIAAAEHDTASAVAAVPAKETRFVYVSSGTWSLMGTEIEAPLLTEEAASLNFTNEGGINGTYRLLKNIMGLWMIQECKRDFEKQGLDYTFAELVELTKEAKPFQHSIDVDHSTFLPAGRMLERINNYCQLSSQPVPQTAGEYARAIYEGLAFKYCYTLRQIEALTGHRYEGLYIVGGGMQNELLCQWTANAIGKPVWAGPTEASAIGNMLVQWMANGKISNIEQGRSLVNHSFATKRYEPQAVEQWEIQYERFVSFIKKD